MVAKLQTIYSQAQLAAEIGLPAELLYRRAYVSAQASLYSRVVHRKRDGTPRVIDAPHWPLKFMQTRIKELLEELYLPSSRANGFIKGRGIKRNALAHAGKRLILNVDIQDYFGSVHFGRIRRRLMAAPYGLTNDVATTIAKLCTLDGILPIGSPSSPILANIISSKLDYDLTDLARHNGCFYTRYADDITFSTNRHRFPRDLVEIERGQHSGSAAPGVELASILTSNGFALNARKTRLLGRGDSQEVCGIVCNERLNPRSRLRRQIRAMIHAWRKFGLDEAEREWREKYNWRGATSFERSLRGRIEFLIHVRGEDDSVAQRAVERYKDLPNRALPEISYLYRGGWKDNLAKTVCVVEAGDPDAFDWKQGTGFFVRNGYAITNAHTLTGENGVYPEVKLRLPGQFGDFELEATIVHVDQTRDFAIICPTDNDWKTAVSSNYCEVSFDIVQREDHVWIAGFPNFRLGDDCHLLPGQVTGVSASGIVRYFRISQAIVKGNSGGPILNGDGKIVGIATRGVDTHDVANVLANGCLYIADFDQLVLQFTT